MVNQVTSASSVVGNNVCLGFFSSIFYEIFSGKKETECHASGELTRFDTDVAKYYLHIYSTVPGMLKLFSSHSDRMTG